VAVAYPCGQSRVFQRASQHKTPLCPPHSQKWLRHIWLRVLARSAKFIGTCSENNEILKITAERKEKGMAATDMQRAVLQDCGITSR
jgi:hypothetical protein